MDKVDQILLYTVVLWFPPLHELVHCLISILYGQTITDLNPLYMSHTVNGDHWLWDLITVLVPTICILIVLWRHWIRETKSLESFYKAGLETGLSLADSRPLSTRRKSFMENSHEKKKNTEGNSNHLSAGVDIMTEVHIKLRSGGWDRAECALGYYTPGTHQITVNLDITHEVFKIFGRHKRGYRDKLISHVISHEVLHKLLHHHIGFDACVRMDNIAGTILKAKQLGSGL